MRISDWSSDVCSSDLCTVLARNGFASFDLAQRAQHLDLFIAHCGRIEMRRRLHRHQREQLQHVVLHHVADCARIIVERHAPFKRSEETTSELQYLMRI